LVELEELADRLGITSPRRTQEAPALVHLLFFGMGSTSSFHTNSFLISEQLPMGEP
jgi:hypothetical protein